MATVAEQEKILDRVKKLIQQTASSNRAEAEAAAYRACVLIRKHGLELVDPAEMDTILTESEELKQRVLQLEAGIDRSEWDTITAAARQLGQQAAQQAAQAFGSNVVLHSSHYVTMTSAPPFQASNPAQSSPMAHPVPLSSKYAVTCKYCGKRLGVGDPILWQRSVGVWCQTTDCYNNWVNLQNFNP
jgi:hypothetical protein